MSTRRRAIAIAAVALLALAAGCGGGSDRPGQATKPGGGVPGQVGRNVARITGQSPSDVAGAALLALYPDRGHQPNGLVLTPERDWKQAMIAAQFGADPLHGAILPTAGDYLPTAPQDLVTRMTPTGFPRAQGLQALVLGAAGTDVIAALQEKGLHLTQLKAPTPEQLGFQTIPFRGGWAHAYSDEIVVVSAQARDYALPAAAWSAYSGDTVAFVTSRGIPDVTRRLLVQREKLRLQKPTIYVIGPRTVVPDTVATALAAYGPVKRVAGDTPEATAVALARYKDPKTGFGWGLTSGPASVSLVNSRNWGNVFGALAFASAGPQAPLLLTNSSTSLPPVVTRYLRQLHSPRGSQSFVFGDSSSVAPSEFAELDRELAAG